MNLEVRNSLEIRRMAMSTFSIAHSISSRQSSPAAILPDIKNTLHAENVERI